MVVKIVPETKVLKRADISSSLETDIAVSTNEGLQTIWEYVVPVGEVLIFSTRDTFSAYLENASAAEAAAASLVDIIVTNSDKTTSRSLLNQIRYTQVKEFQDKDKMCHLDVKVGEELAAREGEHILIRGNILTATLDASDSYFALTSTRIRRSVFN